MALYDDLPVFKEVYQLILRIFDYTKDFPKEYKYTLGQDMKRDGITVNELDMICLEGGLYVLRCGGG